MSVSALKLALLSILLSVGAAWVTPTPALGQEGPGGQAVTVENRSTTAVRIYALQEGHMVPLGLVNGEATVTLSLPSPFGESDEPIHFVGDLIGSEEWYKSDPVTIRPTEGIELTVDPAHSAVVVG